MRCWRTDRHKLVRDFLNPERDEFYDLAKDPDETTNLIATEDEACARSSPISTAASVRKGAS